MLEVCVDDIGGLGEALAGGAGRIELCSALSLGGLTPSAALISAAVRGPVPVHVLIRPRAGDFIYDAAEEPLIAADIGAAVEAGAAGVVIGASRADTRLDTSLLGRLVSIAHRGAERRGRPVALTLHRAFDLCADPIGALEAAIALGFDRVLTSGGAESALAGMETLAALVQRARGRIRILAAGGIDPGNVASILDAGVDEIHASCRMPHGCTTASSVAAVASAIDLWRMRRASLTPRGSPAG
jgi:copper homeostasis protein